MFSLIVRECRAFWRIAHLIFHILYGIAVIRFVFPRVDRARQRAIKQRWSLQLISLLGVRIRCDQGALPHASLIVANHVSWLDIFVINALTQTHFVCKDDVQRWPVVGWLVEHAGTVFIARGNRAAAARTAQAMTERLAHHECVTVFPEGTTTNGTFMLPFRPALLQAAVDGKAIVTPMAVRYYDLQGNQSFAPAYDGDITMWQCMWAISRCKGIDVHVQVLEPIAPNKEIELGRREIAQIAYQRLAQALNISTEDNWQEDEES